MKNRCGFVAVVGAPNAGKSTFVNQAVGAKVSIVTHKVQTTRTRVMGICLRGDCQLIFADTPGIFQPKRRLDRAMVAMAWQGASDADGVLLLVDAIKGMTDDVALIVAGLTKRGQPVLLALNKTDAVAKPDLLELSNRLNQEILDDGRPLFESTYMISALEGDGVDDVVAVLAARMPEGPWLYGEDQISDMPMRLLAADVTREKILLQLHQELPYQMTVETESWEEMDDGSAKINQIIYVGKEGHKSMVLGKRGRRIKALGIASRVELEEILERRVHLVLFVKVRKWEDDPARYKEWGLDYHA